MAAEVLRPLDLPVLLNNHSETFSTHTSLEATGMTRIKLALATVLSLAFTPLAAQETNCDGWNPSDWEVAESFWQDATVITVSLCLVVKDVNARNEYGTTPLIWAAFSNENPEVLTVLLDAGADVNARDEYGTTPLHAAGVNKNPEVLTLLLDAGVNVNARDEDGITPLLIAARHNQNPEVLTVLLNAGADVNARVDDVYKFSGGGTPLHHALSNENPEVFTVLLDAGADVNARDESGHTPLHWAAFWKENPEVIIVLLDAGADGTAVNEDGQTPFDIAKDNEALAGTDAYWALNEARYE